MSVYMTEEEQIQVIKKWWSRYSSPILVIISIGMLAMSGYKYWTWHHEKVLAEASNVYEHLMVSFSNHEVDASRDFAHQLVKQYPKTVYADVARLTLAKLEVESEQFDKAKDLLSEVVLHSQVSALKQIAKIRIARLLLAKKDFNKALEQITVIDDPAYLAVVNELKGDIFAQQHHYQKAIQSYKQAIEEAKQRGLGNLFLEMKTNELASLTESMQHSSNASQVG